MNTLQLAWNSLLNRRLTACLTIFSIGLSVALLLGVERIRHEAQNSFTSTVSGTDLIIGARSGSIQLLLYSVFHMGNATNNISWQSYQEIAKAPKVKWTIPISLGDSHRGFRVMGTNSDLFRYYRYSAKKKLQLSAGKPFSDLYDAVIGADVAAKLGYKVGSKITLSHGIEKISLTHHDDKPFKVSGILAKTGTPMDQVVLISLEGIEALHVDWQQGAPPRPGLTVSAERAREMQLQPHSITAFMVGLKSRISVFALLRQVNEYRQEALLAIMPSLALLELWKLLSIAEKALLSISALVVLAGLIGMLTAILTSLSERRREMAILRSMGARPRHIFSLMMVESLLYGLAGCLVGLGLLYGILVIAQPVIQSYLGLWLPITAPSLTDWYLILIVIGASLIMGIIPAWRAYRNSLADGLAIRY